MTTGDYPRQRRVLTAAAIALAAMTALLAYFIVIPVWWNGPGRLAAVALAFPLHLLLVTAGATWLARRARRLRAGTAASLFSFVAIATAVMAIVPTFAVWWRARSWHQSLSPVSYLANAARMNAGVPEPSRSVVYGTAPDGTRLVLDVWRSGRPASGPPRPAMVWVHGGAWVDVDRAAVPDWNRWLNGLGFEVFDVAYRVPPPDRWRDEVGDVKAALGWVSAHAAEYHVDPRRISVMGSAAGGNLAMLAAYTSGDPRLPPSTRVEPVRVRSVINLYGPTDLELLYRTGRSRAFLRSAMGRYIGGGPAEMPERYRILSPLSHVSERTPPTLTLLGANDRVVEQAHAWALDQALTAAGVRHETYLLPFTDHGFDLNWGGWSTQVARTAIATFLRRYP